MKFLIYCLPFVLDSVVDNVETTTVVIVGVDIGLAQVEVIVDAVDASALRK